MTTTDAGSKGSTQKKAPELTADQVAVRQLVTVVPEPRTADELVARYAGLATEHMWPEQSQQSVRDRLDELIELGVLKEGEAAPDKSPTIVTA